MGFEEKRKKTQQHKHRKTESLMKVNHLSGRTSSKMPLGMCLSLPVAMSEFDSVVVADVDDVVFVLVVVREWKKRFER